MALIFISYRRTDSALVVGRIYDHLKMKFGRSEVFKDVDSIPLGVDFRRVIADAVEGCKVVVAVIGPDWVNARDEGGKRRLEDPDDFVRIEIEAALRRDIPVIPIFVGGARVPGRDQLPASMAELTFRNGISVRSDPDFVTDMGRLIRSVGHVYKRPRPAWTKGRGSLATAAIGVMGVLGAALIGRSGKSDTSPTAGTRPVAFGGGAHAVPSHDSIISKSSTDLSRVGSQKPQATSRSAMLERKFKPTGPGLVDASSALSNATRSAAVDRKELPGSPAHLAASRWAFMDSTDGGEWTEIVVHGVAEEVRDSILVAVDAASHNRDLTPRRRIDVTSAEVVETYSVAGCAVAEIATLEYQTTIIGSERGTTAPQVVAGRGACIGADRKEAVVEAVESAAKEMKARLGD